MGLNVTYAFMHKKTVALIKQQKARRGQPQVCNGSGGSPLGAAQGLGRGPGMQRWKALSCDSSDPAGPGSDPQPHGASRTSLAAGSGPQTFVGSSIAVPTSKAPGLSGVNGT